MHKLILNGLQGGSCEDNEPVKTAEEVLQEIDDIIQVNFPLKNLVVFPHVLKYWSAFF